MSQTLLGGNASTADYDYQSGSGMDGFMSRSLDEVSWQTSLGSVYTTLGTTPIGLLPTTTTPTNYDSTQISGSQSGTTTLGGSSGGNAAGNAGGATAGIVIQPGSNNIEVYDGTNNRAIFGYNPATNTWGFFATPPGTDIGNATTPQQLAMSSDFSQVLIAIQGSINFPELNLPDNTTTFYQAATVPHGLNFTPAYLAYLEVVGGTTITNINFPTNYYTALGQQDAIFDLNGTEYLYNTAIDSTNFYINRTLASSDNVPVTAAPSTINFYILQQTASSNTQTPNISITSGTVPTP